ncbi:MAG: GntR family transcriptional regulator [Lachnospiraceae bacterium]|nr:GntR family transcriptional regulator [Lachnospiraceae bacterium]
MILIDHKDRRPIYEQIIERFQQMILCGALQPGAPMPSVRSLAMELSLNPNTIQRAYQELERTGYIYTIKGKGSFVSETATAAANKRRQLRRELQAFTDKALLAGISAQELQGMLAECIQGSSVSTNKTGDEKYDNSDQC